MDRWAAPLVMVQILDQRWGALKSQTVIHHQKKRKLKVLERHKALRKKRSPRSRLFHLREDGNAHPAPIMIARGRRRVRSNELQITGVSNFHWFSQKKIMKVEFKLCVTPWKPWQAVIFSVVAPLWWQCFTKLNLLYKKKMHATAILLWKHLNRPTYFHQVVWSWFQMHSWKTCI